MRKRVHQQREPPGDSAENWLDLERLAEVEVTSEDPNARVEQALVNLPGAGWRASQSGGQTLRLLFETPQTLRRIRLRFVEAAVTRTQEFVLRWSPDGGKTLQEIVRQRWNFSPQGATCEQEDYRVALHHVTLLELMIIPDVNGGAAHACLAEMRLA